MFVRKVIQYILIPVVLFAAGVLSAHADIYMYIDSQGVTHFTNTPTSSKFKIYMREGSTRAPSIYTSSKYDRIISEASRRHGIAFPLLKAQIKVESDFNPRAVSKKGALGLMQIMPENIKALRVNDPFDPRENIMAGARYFKRLLERYNGELHLALAAYNAGPNAVDQYKRVPPYRETVDYVEKVMKYFQIFKKG
ncbi:transglycosylase SLT domain-containing protein [Thermodesulfobacteriota bacterium]